MLDIKGNERFDSMDVKSVSIDESYPQERFYRKENDSHSCEVKNRHVNNIDRGKLNEKLDRLRDQEQILVNEIQKFKENTREMRKENIMEGQRFKINRNQNNHDNQINHNCAKNSQKAMDIPKSPTLNQNPGPKSNETLCKRDHRKKVTRSNSSGIVQNRIGDAYGDSKIKSSMRFSQEEINTKSNRQCKTNLSRSSDDINDLLTLRQEKVVLVQKLGYLEDKAHEIQTNVQKINREKDHLNELYNKSKEEIHRLKSELHHSKHNKCHTIKTKDCCSGANIFETTSKLNATLREIESEKEKALFNLSRVSAERDNVIAKYKIEAGTSSVWFYQRQIESLNSEKSRLQDECEKKQARIQAYLKDLNDYHVKITKLERSLMDEKVLQDRLRSEIQQASESRLEYQVKFDELYRDFVSNKQMYLDLKTQFEMTMEEKTKLEKEYSQHKSELNRTLGNLRHIEKKYSALSTNHEQLYVDNEILKGEYKDLNIKYKELIENYERILKEHQVLKSRGEELTKFFEENEKKLEEYEGKIMDSEKKALREHEKLEIANEKLRKEEKTLNKLLISENKLRNDNQKLWRTLELANKDKKSLESYIDELKRVNQKLLDTKVFQEEEIKNRSTRERNLEDLVSQLEFDLKKRNEEINFEKESKQEIINQRDTTRNKFENLERDYINIQDQLKTHEKNLNQLESACKKLTTQQERDASKMKEMKSSYQKMEGEKKNFETLYRSAQDKLTVSDVNLKQLNNYIVEAKSQIALLERNSEIYQSQLSEKTCELNTCQSELSELKKFINESRMCMDSTERELTRFREENHLLMQENSKLASEINENVKIRAELEKNINEHVLSMPKLQKALEEMNNERCILSQQLQDAFEELKNWRFRWENCDKECNFFKSECEQMKGDFLRERDKNELLERDLIQIKSSLTSAEMQISSLNKISNDAQEKTREYQIEIEHMISEVNKLRDSIKKTNSTKSFLESDIINKQIEIDQLKSHIDELELNLQEQKEAVYHEKTQNRSLLKSVENDREKLGNCEKLLKDANKEILVMKDRLEDFKLKNTNLSKELSKMRMIFMEAERETNRLSKNLAQEKCEKERLISEARMNSLPSGYKPSGYLSNYMQTKNLEEDRLEDV